MWRSWARSEALRREGRSIRKSRRRGLSVAGSPVPLGSSGITVISGTKSGQRKLPAGIP